LSSALLSSQTIRPPPTPTLFPYTTLFRSEIARRAGRLDAPAELVEDGGRSSDILETDVADAEIGDLVEDRKAILHRQIVARSSTDRKSTRLNSSHVKISYAVFCLKKKNKK